LNCCNVTGETLGKRCHKLSRVVKL